MKRFSIVRPSRNTLFRIGLMFSSLILFRLSFAGGPFPFLGWVTLVPVGIGMFNLSPRKAGLLIGVYEILQWATSVWWLAPAAQDFLELPAVPAWMGLIIFSVITAIPHGFFGWMVGYFKWLHHKAGAFKMAIAYTILLGWYPLLFPGNLTHSQFRYPLMIQVLDLGGVHVLVFFMAWVNWQIVVGILSFQKTKTVPYSSLLTVALLMGFIIGYGSYRIHSLETEAREAGPESRIKIGMTQPLLKRKDRLSILTDFSEKFAQEHPEADVFVWPEIPMAFSFGERERHRSKVQAMIKKAKRPFIIVSSFIYNKDMLINHRPPYYNAVHWIDKEGQMRATHNKRILLPFAEYLPFEQKYPILRKWLPNVLYYIPGTDTQTFEIQGKISIIPLICYEVIFPDLTREFVQNGGNFIITMANDYWFGDNYASLIHFSLALFRAVENRVPLVRVTNSGVSAFVTATGRILPGSESPLYQPVTSVYEMSISQQRSLYTLWGNWFLYLLTLLFFLDFCWYTWQKRALSA